jgi:hypothetical protein
MFIVTNTIEESRSGRSEMYLAADTSRAAKHIALRWSARLREQHLAINISPLRGK